MHDTSIQSNPLTPPESLQPAGSTRFRPGISRVLAIGLLAFNWGCAASADSGTSGAALAGSGDVGSGNGSDSTGSQVAQNPNGTNVSLGGAQDIGFFRAQLEAGQVPTPESLDAAGFFAEHHSELPPPSCGERVCLQPMLAVMSNLMNGNNCTMLQLGLNSPLAATPDSRPPLSLAVVVDVSGSMLGEKIDYVRDGLELLVDGMKDEDQLALVTYSDAAEVLVEMTPVENQRVELRQAARSLIAEGSTNLEAGLRLGYQEVAQSYDSGRQNRVILLSDGMPTAGITNAADILDMSRAYNSDGIGLTSIGLGLDFNASLMNDLALQADGNFYFLEDTGAVDEVFTEELSFFTVPVAFDLELEVTAGADYEFGRALGTPFWEDTANGGRLDVPSVFLAHREAASDVTESGGRRGGGSALMLELMPNVVGGDEDDDSLSTVVASVEVSFREPGTNERVTDEIDIEYPYGPGVTRREGHFAGDDIAAVQKSFVMLNIFVAMENAIRTFFVGEANDNTIAELDNLIAAVEDYNDEVQDEDIELDLELLGMLRANLVRSGVAAESVEFPADPWPAD